MRFVTMMLVHFFIKNSTTTQQTMYKTSDITPPL